MSPLVNTPGNDEEAMANTIGDARIRTEILDSHRAENYRNTFAPLLPRLTIGDVLPAGWEGLYFPFTSSFDELRPDGTPLDDVIPDFGLPRRMYAGEDTVYHRPLHLGDTVDQVESLGVVKEKIGKRGRLVFADIKRTYSVDGKPAIETVWHDVFLEDVPTGSEQTTKSSDPFRLGDGWQTGTFIPDSRHLFRFSAITFNTHRVHYDRAWAQENERLPDLLVHGPLTRNLLLDAVTRKHSGWCPATFSFTASAPLFVGRTITIAIRNLGDAETETVALNDQGELAARGIAYW